jgi:hypothetical protein
MVPASHLHFRTMSPEARQSALQRLAWRGFDPHMISEQTGLPESEVRRVIEAHVSYAPTQPIETASFIQRFRSRHGRH